MINFNNHNQPSTSTLPPYEGDTERQLAHDIRNSISMITLNLSVLKRKCDPEFQPRIQMLESELLILNEMVEGLRELHRIQKQR